VALVRRPPKGLLGGMLGLPTTPWRPAPWDAQEASLHAPHPGPWREAGAVSHVFTHFSLDLRVLAAKGAGGAGESAIWTPLADALAGTPTLFRKALELIR
jgi:A/G-specific adenine glycosylase